MSTLTIKSLAPIDDRVASRRSRPRAARVALSVLFIACSTAGTVAACGGSNGALSPDAGDAGHERARDAAHPIRDGEGEATLRDSSGGPDGSMGCTVHTTTGDLQGSSTSSGGCAYLGVRYAAPPLAALRWKPPQPVAPGKGITMAQKTGSSCPQLAGNLVSVPSTDEDCLYLNVWVPPSPKKAPAPIMLFMHGGGFDAGTGADPTYDGTKLSAATGNVVVTINYRLGALGFLSLPALRTEDPAYPTSGNYGILDQIAALQWVHSNAMAFGADAKRFMIFGQSSGGTAMYAHLASPKSAGLFSRVGIESGPSTFTTAAPWAPYGSMALTTAAADAIGSSLAAAIGCTHAGALLSCLRATPATAFLYNQTFPQWPVVDGYVLTQDPAAALDSGSFNKAPTLIGNNKGELYIGWVPPYGGGPPTDAASYQALADSYIPGHGAAMVAQYPISAYGGSYAHASAVLLGDAFYDCPARRVARALVSAGVPTFRYDFTHAVEVPGLGTQLGSFHTSELLFVFGNTLFTMGVTLRPSERPLSHDMIGYWGSLAATGDPNGGGRFTWLPYALATEEDIVLDEKLSTETKLSAAHCDFWDSLVGTQGDGGVADAAAD